MPLPYGCNQAENLEREPEEFITHLPVDRQGHAMKESLESVATARRVTAMFNIQEYDRLVRYAKKKRISMYDLAKRAIREYVESHPV